jgi:hypothetical protein
VLQTVSVPVAELASVKPTHVHVLLGLLSFTNADGRCWPSLRKLAEITGLNLTRVHRAIAEMESAGLLTRVRRGAGTLYQLAERFLWRAIRPKGVAVMATPPKGICSTEPKGVSSTHTLCSASATVSSASATEGESRKEEVREDSKREDGPVRLAPPPAAVGMTPTPRPARPAEGPNPHARRQWLRTLNSFIGERLRGPQQWGGWEVVTKAMNGDPLAPDEKRSLDGLDRMMRACGYRAAGGS